MIPLRLAIFALLGCFGVSFSTAVYFGRLPTVRLPDMRQPLLSVNEFEHDFGELQQYAKMENTFVLKNTSDKSLRLAKPITDCGCTVAELDRQVLAPGETTELRAQLHTGKDRGDVMHRIGLPFLEYDDKASAGKTKLLGQISLTVKAKVEPDVLLLPPRLVVHRGESSEHVVKLSPNICPKIVVTKVHSSHSAFEVELFSDKPDTSGAWQIRVRFAAEKWNELSTRTQIPIYTDNPREPVVFWPVDIGLSRDQYRK